MVRDESNAEGGALAYPELKPTPMADAASELMSKAWVPAAAVPGIFTGAWLLYPSFSANALLAIGTGLSALALTVLALGWGRRQARRQYLRAIAQFVEHDAGPVMSTDAEGCIVYANPSMREWLKGATVEGGVAACLAWRSAAPLSVFRSILRSAAARGAAHQEFATADGPVRISAHRIGGGGFLWRVDRLTGEGDAPGAIPWAALSIAGRLESMNAPMQTFLGRSNGLLTDFLPDGDITSGKRHKVRTATGAADAIVFSSERADGRRELILLPVSMLPPTGVVDWQFFDALPVAMLKVDPEGCIVLANRLARDLLGHSAPIGKRMSDLLEGPGRSIFDWLEDTLLGRTKPGSEVLRAVRPTSERFLQVTLSRLDDADGPAVVATLHDATELKTLEAQFVQSQKMQAIGQLAGGVAHDFNNLLTAISGHCDLMLLRHEDSDPDYGDLMQIHQNANRAASLVGQLLAFSRKQTLKPELLDLRDTMSDLAHLLNRLVGEKVVLEVEHDQDLKLIRADKRQIEQVIMNLVVNARDAMPRGGRIEIATSVVSLAAPMVRDRAEIPAGSYVVVKVTDQGVGIPLENLSKIFEPFFSTKKVGEGTGLGLSTAYGIIKQTGGFIFADTQLGMGTTFTLFFPAHEQPVAIGAAPAEGRADLRLHVEGEPGGVVLLVEDEAPVRAFASRALRLRGYTVIEAETAEEALKRLEDAALKVDIFVTDVVMPGLDGPSWVREALKERPETRVVFVSGYAEDRMAEDQRAIPNSVFLPKPFSLNQLTATVHAQLH